MLLSLKIRGRLVLGSAFLILLLVAATTLTAWHSQGVTHQIDQVAGVRVPTAVSGSRLVSDVHASLAALRGWLITGDAAFKEERAAIWRNIDDLGRTIDALSAHWIDPHNRERWTAYRDLVEDFRRSQERIEAIAHTPEEQPALRILVTEAAPLVGAMIERITVMIDEERTQDEEHVRPPP